jgi:hypothetical protein
VRQLWAQLTPPRCLRGRALAQHHCRSDSHRWVGERATENLFGKNVMDRSRAVGGCSCGSARRLSATVWRTAKPRGTRTRALTVPICSNHHGGSRARRALRTAQTDRVRRTRTTRYKRGGPSPTRRGRRRPILEEVRRRQHRTESNGVQASIRGGVGVAEPAWPARL